MKDNRSKLMEELRARLALLEAEAAREEELQGFMQEAYDQLVASLSSRGASLEDFVGAHQAELKKLLNKQERGGRIAKVSKASKVKIPAGRYTNIPSAPGVIFTVKEKGPRPKPVREYAESVGVDAFMQQCVYQG